MAVDEAIIERLRVTRPTPAGRPWIAVTMVSALDGGTAIGGRSGGLGNETDRAVLTTMRSVADVVLVGAGTVRAEKYRTPKRPGLRLVVVSGTLELDWDDPLWHSPQVTVLTTEQAPAVPAGVQVLRAGIDRVDLGAAVRLLGATTIVCEGGPSLNGQLLGLDLVDEVVLTLAPFAVSGTSSRVAHGHDETVRRFQLAHAVPDGDWLFVRYLRTERAVSPPESNSY